MWWILAELPRHIRRLCGVQETHWLNSSSASSDRLLSAIHSFTMEGRWKQLSSCTSFPDILSKPSVPIDDWIVDVLSTVISLTESWCFDFDEPNILTDVSFLQLVVILG